MTQRRELMIVPSILSADFGRLGEEVRAVEAGGADAIHIDVMDGHFVPNITVGPLVVRSLRPMTDLPLQVHLMIEEPERYIPDFVQAGADLITVHVETCPLLYSTLEQIRRLGTKPGVTLNPATPLSALDEVLDRVDLILVMTVDPGFGGQRLVPSTLAKVARLRAMLDERGLDPTIEVDGGVNGETLQSVVSAGANALVMGSAIFGHPKGPRRAVEQIRRALNASMPAPG